VAPLTLLQGHPCLRFRPASAIAGLLALGLASCPGPKPEAIPSPAPTPTVTPTPTPLPETFVPYSKIDTARLFNGFEIHSKLATTQGDTAIVERHLPDAYTLNLEVNVRVPQAAKTLEQLQTADPKLSTILPGLEAALPQAKISNFYHGLYQLKINSLDLHLNRLEQLLSRHNFFDCNTILELTSPETARKVLLIQSDMDVNADGSDSDRIATIEGNSTNFQPFTSYRWPKKSPIPSQFLPERETKLKAVQTELADRGITPERRRSLQEQSSTLIREIGDLKRYSFLVSKNDPFIVLPGFMLRQPAAAFTPRIGDYAVIIYRGVLYPALLGDAGPSYKMGEASLRIASELDRKANAYNRPETNLDITYLVFPGSAEGQPSPPDLKKLHERCTQLLHEIGDTTGQLWEWPDLLAIPPAPSPNPSGSPRTVASPSPSPSLAPASSPVSSPEKSER
jgi:Fungal chitosanase of glycosyl hydrolase group 75